MKVTWNWLSEFVEMQVPLPQLAERLTMAGLEVESIEERGRELAGVRCAELVRVRPHPDAERLSVCEVRLSSDAVATVVCGATNLRAGDRVAFAAVGATLPDGRRIEAATIRGVASAGMLCSEAELGLGLDAAGILTLPADAAIGGRISAILGLEDTVLDIAVTPNRGDCLSVLGIAREISALTGQRLRRQRISVSESDEAVAELLDIQVAEPSLCGRYVGRVVSGVQVGSAPLWMQGRLRAVGMRPVNSVVDATNYVMCERGQPLHAFDYDRLPHKEIVVRRAGRALTFVTLDGQARNLHADDLLICSGDEPVAVAGVMGGVDTEVTLSTRRILLESAWFDPGSVRRTAKRLGLRSEASYRFERTTDIEGVAHAADRVAGLVARLAGGSVARGRVDVYPAVCQPAPVALRLKRADDLLGVSVSRAEIVSRLRSLGMAVAPATRGTLTVVPPSYRSDVSREVDLIEEIARLVGYDRIPATLPECAMGGAGAAADQRRERNVKRFLAARGLNEVVLLSFCSPLHNAQFPGLGEPRSPATILNPLTQDESQLRMSLCPGLLQTVRDNLAQGASGVAAFSVGKVFWQEGGYREARRLGGVISGALPRVGLGSRDAAADFADVKGVVEALLEFLAIGNVRWSAAGDLPAFHPGKTARLAVEASLLGIVGALHPQTAERLGVASACLLFELDFERLLDYCPPRIVFQDLPRFPAVVRDMAVVADDGFASDQVIRFVREWSSTARWIEDIYLFDQYVGPPIPSGKKSLAYSISYRAPDRTLTDAEVNEMHAEVIAALKDSLPVEPR